MKHMLGAIALLLSTCIVACGQADRPKRQDAPTFDETVQWLAQQLPALAAYEGKLNGSAITLRVISATFDGASCTLLTHGETVLPDGLKSGNGGTYLFSLISLDPEKILVERSPVSAEPPNYELTLSTKDGKRAIRRTIPAQNDHGAPRVYTDMISKFALNFDSEETARRFEKAFKHAVQMSQASKELF